MIMKYGDCTLETRAGCYRIVALHGAPVSIYFEILTSTYLITWMHICHRKGRKTLISRVIFCRISLMALH